MGGPKASLYFSFCRSQLPSHSQFGTLIALPLFTRLVVSLSPSVLRCRGFSVLGTNLYVDGYTLLVARRFYYTAAQAARVAFPPRSSETGRDLATEFSSCGRVA